MGQATSNTTIDTLRTFAAPAVNAGLISKAELDSAFEILEQANRNEKPERLVTFKDAANQLGVSRRTVARMLHCEELRGKRLRQQHPQTMRIFQSSIDAILTPVTLSKEGCDEAVE